MNSMERTLQSLQHKSPDRVPLFLLFSHYGAKHLNRGIKEYFHDTDAVVRAQIELQRKFSSDCYYTFQYAALETEAMGGEVRFFDEAPPNAGPPILKSRDQLRDLAVPDMTAEPLKRILSITGELHHHSRGEIPIIGVVMSPFSLPVMQMGFEEYIKVLYRDPDFFEELMAFNAEFCAGWANAQLEAGATAICYFNPLASREIIEAPLYNRTGKRADLETTGKIKGPVAFHLASGISEPSVEDVIATGSAVIGVSSRDNLKLLKKETLNRITILGNINALDLVHADPSKIDSTVKEIIHSAGRSGGLILSENHGEIPWQAREENLFQISESVKSFSISRHNG